MGFSSNGYTPVSIENLTVGETYRTRIRDVKTMQVAEGGLVVDKLVLALDVSGVRAARPDSISFKSRPLTNEKNQQTRWDERWTRFKEIFGIPYEDENYEGWRGKIGMLKVDSYKDTRFFSLPLKEAGAPEPMRQPAPASASAQAAQSYQQPPASAQQYTPPAQSVAPQDFLSIEDIPF